MSNPLPARTQHPTQMLVLALVARLPTQTQLHPYGLDARFKLHPNLINNNNNKNKKQKKHWMMVQSLGTLHPCGTHNKLLDPGFWSAQSLPASPMVVTLLRVNQQMQNLPLPLLVSANLFFPIKNKSSKKVKTEKIKESQYLNNSTSKRETDF